MKNESEIIKHYGVDHQLRKLTEEVFELQQAIVQFEDGVGSKEHIIEEYADVRLVLNQFKEHYKIDERKARMIYEYKKQRTFEKMTSPKETDTDKRIKSARTKIALIRMDEDTSVETHKALNQILNILIGEEK